MNCVHYTARNSIHSEVWGVCIQFVCIPMIRVTLCDSECGCVWDVIFFLVVELQLCCVW